VLSAAGPRGVLSAAGPRGVQLIISAIEHPATMQPARQLERLGAQVTIVGVDPEGRVDPEEVAANLGPKTRLVSIIHANNETGVIQPIGRIARLCRDRGVLVHTDAAQSFGKIPTRVDDLGVDLLSIAGHKLYAPKGVGALYVRRGVALEPWLLGGGQENGLRPGTENVASIVGLGAAAAMTGKAMDDAAARMATLRDRLLIALRRVIGPSLSLNGQRAERLPNTLSVNFPDVDARELLARIPELCASTGAACHSGHTDVSATLAAMGVRPEIARGTVRLSLGWYSSEEQIDRAAELLLGSWEALAR
jgi:cysteine desulfurase